MRLFAIVATILATTAGPAHALPSDASQIRQLVHSMAPTAPRPPGPLIFHGDAGTLCVQALGCVYEDSVIHYTAGQVSAEVIYHEIGHVFDQRVMDPAGRDAFQRAVGVPGTWGGVAHEWFAEAYGWCAFGNWDPAVFTQDIRWWSDSAYGYHVTGRQQRRVCRLLRYARERRSALVGEGPGRFVGGRHRQSG